MLIRNSWYVGAWSSEIEPGRPFGRTLLNEPVVMFRTEIGEVVALEGRCAHRRMPLMHGKVIGSTIVCCYHGLAYDADGKCVAVPGEANPPPNIELHRYPAVERYGAVWIWMGDPELADETKIFDCGRVGLNCEKGQKFYWHVNANYLYLNDNLSDLLHQAFLHNPSFGGNANPLGGARPKFSQDGDRIYVDWDWYDLPAPATFAQVGGIDGLADGWNHSVYVPPCFYVNTFGFATAGTGAINSNRPQGAGKASTTFYQLITPETERTTHFFKLTGCDWPQELRARFYEVTEAVNREDNWACEEQQKMEDHDPSSKRHVIPSDRAVLAMRRIVERLYNDEARAARETATAAK
jgi:phenylpropionate dioxygenase-like ring-hydroxylating dioxygenase large terminal subunit